MTHSNYTNYHNKPVVEQKILNVRTFFSVWPSSSLQADLRSNQSIIEYNHLVAHHTSKHTLINSFRNTILIVIQ